MLRLFVSSAGKSSLRYNLLIQVSTSTFPFSLSLMSQQCHNSCFKSLFLHRWIHAKFIQIFSCVISEFRQATWHQYFKCQMRGFGPHKMYGLSDVLDLPCFASSMKMTVCIKRRRRKWGSLCDIIGVWTDKCHHHHRHHLDLITIIAESSPRSYLILIKCANDVTLRLERFWTVSAGGSVAPLSTTTSRANTPLPQSSRPRIFQNISRKHQKYLSKI